MCVAYQQKKQEWVHDDTMRDSWFRTNLVLQSSFFDGLIKFTIHEHVKCAQHAAHNPKFDGIIQTSLVVAIKW